MAAGTLPQVSWIHGPAVQCEHPATAPQWGENLVQTVLDTLTSNPEVWAHTLFILNYDENGGFFDHVPPPVPPAGTPGEYLTLSPLPSNAGGIAGPVGLGFRVPCILMSPFTQGGFRATEVFDHTSTLRLMETLFGVEVPNLSAWRRSVTGDMTSALALGQPPATTVPSLPAAPLVEPTVDEQIILNSITGTFDEGFPIRHHPRTTCRCKRRRRLVPRHPDNEPHDHDRSVATGKPADQRDAATLAARAIRRPGRPGLSGSAGAADAGIHRPDGVMIA